MDLHLTGQVAFISGSTAGIGLGIARRLLQEGVEVIINGRSTSSVEETISRLRDEFPSAILTGFAADFSEREDVENLIKHLPPIDILVNNVGTYTAQSYFDTPDEDWSLLFEVNVMSGVRLSRACLSKMLERGSGRILFISSECAELVPEDLIAYSASKKMIHALSRGLAQLTKGTAITVNTIVPGSTMSKGAEEFLQVAATKSKQSVGQIEANFFSQVRTTSLLQRFATVDEIASLACYLASPLSAATNGAIIRVDGGSIPGAA